LYVSRAASELMAMPFSIRAQRYNKDFEYANFGAWKWKENAKKGEMIIESL